MVEEENVQRIDLSFVGLDRCLLLDRSLGSSQDRFARRCNQNHLLEDPAECWCGLVCLVNEWPLVSRSACSIIVAYMSNLETYQILFLNSAMALSSRISTTSSACGSTKTPTWFRPRPNIMTPSIKGLETMMPSMGAGTVFSPEARVITSSVLPTLSHCYVIWRDHATNINLTSSTSSS